jgi:hypothetical protein
VELTSRTEFEVTCSIGLLANDRWLHFNKINYDKYRRVQHKSVSIWYQPTNIYYSQSLTPKENAKLKLSQEASRISTH